MIDLSELLKTAAGLRASDVFLKEGVSPSFRVNGSISATDYPVLSADDVKKIAYSVLTPEQIGMFEAQNELDLAFTIEGVTRVRANFYRQRNSMGVVLRLIPLQVLSLQQLCMPTVVADMSQNKQGLILVTGPTGSGKSTTLAAIIDLINASKPCNIISIEDPIEFVHEDKMAIVSQREIGADTKSFNEGLKYIVRQSPDVILIGEMRDTETMQVVLQAAETGHLVLSTLHTSSAAETVERIINMFPPHEKEHMCMRLAASLKGVVSQKLIPMADGNGRIAAVEIMVVTPTIAKLIEDGHFGQQLSIAISEGEFWGMQTINQSLVKFVKKGWITEEQACINAGNLTELKQMLRR